MGLRRVGCLALRAPLRHGNGGAMGKNRNRHQFWFEVCTVTDSIYSKAAINPYPLALSDSFLLIFLVAVWSANIEFRSILSLKRRINRYLRAIEGVPPVEPSEPSLSEMRRLSLMTSVVTFMHATTVIAILMYSLFLFASTSQSILARRLYESNRDIIAPYLSSQQLAGIQSRFTQVTTKAGYIQTLREMKEIATSHGVKLRDETTDFLK